VSISISPRELLAKIEARRASEEDPDPYVTATLDQLEAGAREALADGVEVLTIVKWDEA
jgi:hypothetical protein